MSIEAKALRDQGYLWHLDWDVAANLGPADQEFRDAVSDYQLANLEDYAVSGVRAYGRMPVLDGECGPATKAVLLSDRGCPLPRYAPPEGARFAYDDPDLQRAVESMQAWRAITGSGSWPANCYPDVLANRHVVKVFFDVASFSSKWKQWWPEAQPKIVQGFARRGVLLHVVGSRREANVVVEHRNGNGWIGLAQFPDGTCGDTPFCYVDTSYAPSIDGVCQLTEHELGHNMALPHTSRNDPLDVMSSIISWRNEGFVGFADDDRSTPRLQRFFGDEPIEAPDPDPDPDPKEGWRTVITFEDDGQTYRVQRKTDDDGGWGPV